VRQQHRQHIVLGGILFAGLSSAFFGLGAAAPAHTVAGAMTGMRMARPAAPPPRTVVLLHQRVVRVTIHNFAFQPARLVVSPGTRIIWTNQDSDPHTATGDKGGWASDALDTGNQFARVFKAAGAFPYHCQIHPIMHGTIVVKK